MVLYESYVHVPVKHELSETFEREKFYEKFVGEGELHYLVNSLCKIQSHDVF